MTLRYRVQVRAAGEPWRTVYAPKDREAAHRMAAELLEERATFNTPRWAHVCIRHGESLVGMWDQGMTIAPPVAGGGEAVRA